MISIFTTTYKAYEREELYDEAMACYYDLADEVVEVDDPWPEEFDWTFIGEQFQKGYERCSGEWVIHADLDYIFHENDFNNIKKFLFNHDNEPGVNFWKYQFYTPDKYTLKSRMVIAVNKKKFGDRIKFNGGGDLCQPTLDGKLLNWRNTLEARIPFYCYDALIKTKAQQEKDRARFAWAYYRHFGSYDHGHPDTALEDWLAMVRGRYSKHQPFNGTHPKYVQNVIKNLKPKHFGYNMWGKI